MARKRIVFTPRIIGAIWKILNWYGLFMDNPDAPSEKRFQAHYAESNANSTVAWTDKAHGVTYLYDLSINQAQVTPILEPDESLINRLNKRLWAVLPPDLLDTNDNWKAVWLKAAKRLDKDTMLFIIEQGFDVNVTDEYGFTALYHAVTPYGGSYDIVRLLVEAGADLALPNNTIDFLIKVGGEGVSGNGEASEAMSIASYLRSMA